MCFDGMYNVFDDMYNVFDDMYNVFDDMYNVLMTCIMCFDDMYNVFRVLIMFVLVSRLSLKIEPSQTPGQRRTPERKVANTKDDMSTGGRRTGPLWRLVCCRDPCSRVRGRDPPRRKSAVRLLFVNAR